MVLTQLTQLPDASGGVLTQRNLDQMIANVTTENTNFATLNTVVGGATGAPTGTGALVLATSPTITTPTLSTPILTGNAQASVGPNYIATENGANNAIACAAASGPTLAAGLMVTVLLAHSLQAGANTFAYNGGAALAIKSHRNPANNIGTAYVSTGSIQLLYDGTLWQDLSQ